MKEFSLSTIENQAVETWDFDTIKKDLLEVLADYENIVYTDDNIKSAKNDKSTLNKAKKVIEDARKEYKKKCMEPYEAVEPKIKELVSLIDERRNTIDEVVKNYTERQKEEKLAEIKKYYNVKSSVLGSNAEPLFDQIFNPKWTNATTSKSKYEEEIQEAIYKASEDINKIKEMNSPFEETLIKEYVDTVSMESVIIKNQELITATQKAGIGNDVAVKEEKSQQAEPSQLDEDGFTTIRVKASQSQMDQLCDYMEMIGIEYKI